MPVRWQLIQMLRVRSLMQMPQVLHQPLPMLRRVCFRLRPPMELPVRLRSLEPRVPLFRPRATPERRLR